ncbi:TauD/TfdA family dioxygenase [Stella sp.]|uniref:TauD/TfdA family dioxygenase n=1 Tax=Stella sp. TaxID=2912054 RepID=UPI0035AD8094
MASETTTGSDPITAAGDRGWLAAAAADPDFWSMRLDPADLAGCVPPDTPDSYRAPPSSVVPAPSGAAMQAILDRLERGPGFVVLRGFPVADALPDELDRRFWGFCRSLGAPLPQTRDGDRLVRVAHDPETAARQIGRWYGSRERLTFHTDRCDVLVLLVVRAAAAGGVTRIASSAAIVAELARERPDLLALLMQDFCWRVPERPVAGAPPFFRQPVVTFAEGRLSCCYNRFQIEAGHRYPGAGALTPQQAEALDRFEALAESERFAFSVRLEPGDVQLVNNHVVLHARTAYADGGDADARRELLRAWLSVAGSRPLAPERAATFGDCRPGRVRGFYPAAA